MISHNVGLDPLDFLPVVIPHRHRAMPPLFADLARCLSMIVPDGFASQLSAWRAATYSASWMCADVPSHAHRSEEPRTVLLGGNSSCRWRHG